MYSVFIMSGFGEHFDMTIWDPTDPEQAIEDPMHGPSAVLDMLSIPPMPLGDDRYYQPGGFYAYGTNYVDSEGNPLPITIASAADTMGMLREMLAVEDWIAVHSQETPETDG